MFTVENFESKRTLSFSAVKVTLTSISSHVMYCVHRILSNTLADEEVQGITDNAAVHAMLLSLYMYNT
jgi:ABC-type Fe3+-siderophore transport system permease subunit